MWIVERSGRVVLVICIETILIVRIQRIVVVEIVAIRRMLKLLVKHFKLLFGLLIGRIRFHRSYQLDSVRIGTDLQMIVLVRVIKRAGQRLLQILLVVGPTRVPEERVGLVGVVEQKLLTVIQIVGYEGMARVVRRVVARAKVGHTDIASVCVTWLPLFFQQ